MPKRSTSSRQPLLFRREIPQMPDGYYSSGPNSNLRSFVIEHANLYDPNIENYQICVGRGEQKDEKGKRGKKKKSVAKLPNQKGDVA